MIRLSLELGRGLSIQNTGICTVAVLTGKLFRVSFELTVLLNDWCLDVSKLHHYARGSIV